jgi:uncharacterized protein YbjT (DUF2867 family)
MGQLKRILVLGGYGLIGLPIIRRLLSEGYEVVGIGRDAGHGRRQEPRCEWVGADIARLIAAEHWRPLIKGVDAVVNASGALQSGPRDNLANLQERAITALVEACEAGTPGMFIQISAPGANPAATTEFLRTKGVADDRLRCSSVDWVILKPGLVVSANAYGGTALLRMLASFPVVLPLVYGNSTVATVDVEEVAEAVAMSIGGAIPARSELEIAEEQPGTLRDVVLAFRSWLGLPKPLAVISLPAWVGNVVGRGADLLGHLGWRSPLRSTALEVMAGGVGADPTAYVRMNGRPPRPLAHTLRRYPATVQERWFASLYLAMPLVVGTLALFWIASGLIGITEIDQASRHLTERGVSQGIAMVAVAAGAIIDILLGVGVLFHSRARLACLGMVGVTTAYLVAGSFGAPELWVDPLGPYVKTIPAAVLALLGSMMVKTR